MPDDKKSETEGTTDSAGAGGGSKSGGDSGADAQYTEAQLQSAVDRAVSKAAEKWQQKTEQEIQAERQKAEEARLQEQGKYKKLFEDKDAELRALKAEQAAAKFRDEAQAALKEKELAELAEVVLSPRETLDDVKAVAARARELLDAKVEAEVQKRLGTGDKPKGNTPAGGTGTQKPETMSAEEVGKYIDEHGREAYQKLVFNARKK